MMKKVYPRLTQSGILVLLPGALEAFAAIVWLFVIPVDEKNRQFLGYSLNRWGIIVILMFACLFCLWLTWKIWRNQAWYDRWLTFWMNPGRSLSGMILGSGVMFSCLFCLFIMRYALDGRYLAYYNRLSPLFIWLVLVGLQSSVWLAYLRFGFHPENLKPDHKSWRIFAIVLGIFAVIALFSIVTGTGIQPDIVDWNGPGIPLLEWQIWLAVFVGCLGLVLTLYFYRRNSSPETARVKWVDVLLGLSIWCLAVVLWLSQPVMRTYFTPEPRLPNNEVYPYSDAADHDLYAQDELIGNGLGNHQVIKRPLLSTFLMLLHLAVGQDYGTLIAVQTLFLACFPVLLYFFAKMFHSRSLGIAVALMAILREVNTIQASPYDQVSDSKMLMSDLPTALGLCLFLLCVILWFKSMREDAGYRKFWMAFICGGLLGAMMLVRVQSALLAVFLLPLGLLLDLKLWRKWLVGSVIFGIGVVLLLLPWVVRNYFLTGQIVFEQSTQTTWAIQRYSQNPNEAPAYLPGESETEYQVRLKQMTFDFMLKNPTYVAGFLAAHFLNNTYSTLLVLPVRGQILDVNDALQITRKFWSGLGEGLTAKQGMLLGINLLLVGLGIAVSWKRWKCIGLVPLAANAAYSLSNAVARNSGWRYMLPLDWVGYFYYMIGLLEAFLWILIFLGFPTEHVFGLVKVEQVVNPGSPQSKKGIVWGWGIGLSLILLMVGVSVPVLEIVFPERYPAYTKDELIELVLSQRPVQRAALTQDDLSGLVTDPNVVLLWGRALYPRYYQAGEGEAGSKSGAYQEREENHLGFHLVGHVDAQVILLIDTSPSKFPNGSDVIVAACREGDLLDAVFVVVMGQKGAIYWRTPSSLDLQNPCASQISGLVP